MSKRQRERAAARKENRDRRPRAIAKYIRMSPRKVRVVINLIRGKSVDEARAILLNTPRIASEVVIKVLDSAIANAENNLDMDASTLYVAEVFADQGPTLKRIWIRGRGSADRILKRSSHITVVLDEKK